MLVCRRYDEKIDKKRVSSFISQINKKGHHPLSEDSYVIYEHNQLTAAVSFYQSYYHPHVVYCKPYFSLGEERIEQLVALIKLEANIQLPIQILFNEKEIWRHMPPSFIQIRTTYIARLSLEQWQVHSELASAEQRSLNELTKQEKRTYQKLVAKTYQEMHLANPVRTLTDNEWRELVFAEDLCMDDSLVYINGDVQGYVRCHTTEMDDEVEIGWIGEKGDCQLIIYDLLRAVFTRLRKRGIATVEVELDSTDPVAIRVLAAFPFAIKTRLVTIQQRQP